MSENPGESFLKRTSAVVALCVAAVSIVAGLIAVGKNWGEHNALTLKRESEQHLHQLTGTQRDLGENFIDVAKTVLGIKEVYQPEILNRELLSNASKVAEYNDILGGLTEYLIEVNQAPIEQEEGNQSILDFYVSKFPRRRDIEPDTSGRDCCFMMARVLIYAHAYERNINRETYWRQIRSWLKWHADRSSGPDSSFYRFHNAVMQANLYKYRAETEPWDMGRNTKDRLELLTTALMYIDSAAPYAHRLDTAGDIPSRYETLLRGRRATILESQYILKPESIEYLTNLKQTIDSAARKVDGAVSDPEMFGKPDFYRIVMTWNNGIEGILMSSLDTASIAQARVRLCRLDAWIDHYDGERAAGRTDGNRDYAYSMTKGLKLYCDVSEASRHDALLPKDQVNSLKKWFDEAFPAGKEEHYLQGLASLAMVYLEARQARLGADTCLVSSTRDSLVCRADSLVASILVSDLLDRASWVESGGINMPKILLMRFRDFVIQHSVTSAIQHRPQTGKP